MSTKPGAIQLLNILLFEMAICFACTAATTVECPFEERFFTVFCSDASLVLSSSVERGGRARELLRPSIVMMGALLDPLEDHFQKRFALVAASGLRPFVDF